MKKVVYIVILLNLVSCMYIKSELSFYDPYENISIKKDKIEKIKKIEKFEEKKPKIRKVVVEKKVEEKEELKPIMIDSQTKYILKRIKSDYSLIESEETIERLTKEYATRIQEKTKKNINILKFISEVHKVVKETKMKSYTLAVTRVLNNWK